MQSVSATLIVVILIPPGRSLPQNFCTSSSICWNGLSQVSVRLPSSPPLESLLLSEGFLDHPIYKSNPSTSLAPLLYPQRIVHHTFPDFSLWYLQPFDILYISLFHWFITWLATLFPPPTLEYKFNKGDNFACFVQGCIQYLQQYLAHCRHSVHVFWINPHFAIVAIEAQWN